jgi:hypothetical protein
MTLGSSKPSEQDETSWAQCGECGQRLVKRDRSRDHDPSATRTQGTPARWHLAVGRIVEGPYTREEILALRSRGACDASTLVHRSGWNEWRSLESVAALIGSERARRSTPIGGWRPSSAAAIGARSAVSSALVEPISRAFHVLKSSSAALGSRLQAAMLSAAGRLSFEFERAGERLLALAESLHPEVLLGLAVLGFMTVVGNVIGLIVVAASAPLSVQAQAASPGTMDPAPTEIAVAAAPSAGLVPRLPALPSRDQVLDALSGTRAQIAKCKGAGTARVSLNVLGVTGRVSTVFIEGLAPGSRACVESAVRNTEFPKFQRDNLRVRVPFKLEHT